MSWRHVRHSTSPSASMIPPFSAAAVSIGTLQSLQWPFSVRVASEPVYVQELDPGGFGQIRGCYDKSVSHAQRSPRPEFGRAGPALRWKRICPLPPL